MVPQPVSTREKPWRRGLNASELGRATPRVRMRVPVPVKVSQLRRENSMKVVSRQSKAARALAAVSLKTVIASTFRGRPTASGRRKVFVERAMNCNEA